MPYKDPAKQREFQRLRAATTRSQEIEKQGGKCMKCVSTVDLEFHHRDRKTKKSHTVWSWSKKSREKELAKCDLLCAECHKLETAKEREYGTAPHGTLTSYKNYGCRCKDCRTANAENEHRRRLRI